MRTLLYHLAGIVAVPAALVLGIAAGSSWCKSVFRGGDDTVAALFGGDGRHSVSAYCGLHQARGTWRVLGVALRKAIDALFGTGHCLDAARREALV